MALKASDEKTDSELRNAFITELEVKLAPGKKIFRMKMELDAPLIKVAARDSRRGYAVTENSLFQINLRDYTFERVLVVPKGERYLCAAFSKDKSRIFIGTNAGNIIEFSLEDRGPANVIPAVTQQFNRDVTEIAVSNSGRLIAFVARSVDIVVIDVERDNFLVHTYVGAHKQSTNCLIFSSDDRMLISGGKDNYIKFWSVELKAFLQSIADAHYHGVTALDLTEKGRVLVSVGGSKVVQIWSTETRENIGTINRAHDRGIRSVAVDESGKFLLSGAQDDNFRLWDYETKEMFHSFDGIFKKTVVSVAFAGEEKIIAGSKDQNIYVYDMKNPETDVGDIKFAHKSSVLAVGVARDNSKVFSFSKDKTLAIWDPLTINEIKRLTLDIHDEPLNMILLKNPNEVLTLCNKRLVITDHESGETLRSFDAEQSAFTAVTVNPECDMAFIACHNTNVIFWNREENKEVNSVFTDHRLRISCMTVTPDGAVLCTGSADRGFKFWRIRDGEMLHDFDKKHNNLICATTFTEDGQYLMTAGLDKSVKIWDLERRELAFSFEKCNKKELRAAAISKDRTFILSGAEDLNIRVWDFQRRKAIYFYNQQHAEPISALAISSDNKYFVSGAEDGSVAINANPFYGDVCRVYLGEGYNPYYLHPIMILHGFLIKETTEEKRVLIETYPDLYVYPFGWTFFHIVAKFNPKKELVRACIASGVPFTLDMYGKTPLHYLFAAKVIDLVLINFLFENFGDIMPTDTNKTHEILSSLSNEYCKILEIDTPFVVNILKYVISKPRTYDNDEIPRFGAIKGNEQELYYASEYSTLTDGVRNHLLEKNGNSMIGITYTRIQKDYFPCSDDMFEIMTSLSEVETDDIYKTPAVVNLIDYLWAHHITFHYFCLSVFSLLMLSLSAYVFLDDGSVALEIVMVIFAIYHIIYELLQYKFSGREEYFDDLWNFIDFALYWSIILTVGLIWTEAEEEITQAVLSLSLFLGYMRWISFFRMLSQTRRLVAILLAILKDMTAFLVVISFQVVGLTLIFLLFDREMEFNEHLVKVYGLIYADFEPDQFNEHQTIYFMILIFMMNVVFFNMLVALMEHTFNEVMGQSALVDGKEKVNMILEAILMKRTVLTQPDFSNNNPYRGYLFFVRQTEDDGDDDGATATKGGGEWENKSKLIRKALKAEIQSIASRFEELKMMLQGGGSRAEADRYKKLDKIESKVTRIDEGLDKVIDYILNKEAGA